MSVISTLRECWELNSMPRDPNSGWLRIGYFAFRYHRSQIIEEAMVRIIHPDGSSFEILHLGNTHDNLSPAWNHTEAGRWSGPFEESLASIHKANQEKREEIQKKGKDEIDKRREKFEALF